MLTREENRAGATGGGGAEFAPVCRMVSTMCSWPHNMQRSGTRKTAFGELCDLGAVSSLGHSQPSQQSETVSGRPVTISAAALGALQCRVFLFRNIPCALVSKQTAH